MFKKRLKGLLAMLLAATIALTALPLTASADFIFTDITVYNGDTPQYLPYYDIEDNESVSPYLTESDLWGVFLCLPGIYLHWGWVYNNRYQQS